MIPSAQQIFASLSKIHFSDSGLEIILKQFTTENLIKLNLNHDRKFEIKKQIRLNNISFAYSRSNQLALKNVNISISAHQAMTEDN